MIQIESPQEMPETTANAALKALQFAGIPTEKLRAMEAFATDLRRRNPKMKPERFKRKVAEKFHIKLI